jgi:hypothetical protein
LVRNFLKSGSLHKENKEKKGQGAAIEEWFHRNNG